MEVAQNCLPSPKKVLGGIPDVFKTCENMFPEESTFFDKFIIDI